MSALHALSPSDLERERRFIQRLTPASLRRRVMGALGRPSEAQLRRLVTPDPGREQALAWLIDDEFVAVARYARTDAQGRQAELAIVVADDWQGRGIGRRLLDALLATARRAGIQGMSADCEADNAAVMALLRGAGFVPGPHPQDAALCRMNLRLEPEGPNTHDHASHQQPHAQAGEAARPLSPLDEGIAHRRKGLKDDQLPGQ